MSTTKSLVQLALILGAAALTMPKAQAAPLDDRPLTEYLSDFVYAIDRPVYVYNWFNADGRDSVWQGHLSAADPAGFDHYKSMSRNYWSSFCSKDDSLNPKDCPSAASLAAQPFGAGNMFGPGLYTAIDPVATVGYGGGNADWVLLQLHLPKGFRMMDLRRDGNTSLPIKLQNILNSYSCPTTWNDMSNGLNLLLSANNNYITGQQMYANYGNGQPQVPLTPQCLLEVRKILKENLKIDGFFYQYSATDFKECDPPTAQNNPGYQSQNPFRQGAFVIASSTSLTANDVRVFNRQTTDGTEDRARIETMFYKADVDSPTAAYAAYFAKIQFPGYPNYTYNSMSQNCTYQNGNAQPTCTNMVYLCPTGGGGTCVQVAPPSMPPTPVLPSIFSNATPPASQLGQQQQNQSPLASSLLWPDLDGAALDAQISPWISANLYGCQLTREYQAVDN